MNKQHYIHQLIDSFHTTQSEIEETFDQGELAKISVIEYGFRNGAIEGGGSATYLPKTDQFSLWMHYTIDGLDVDITHEISDGKETIIFENIGDFSACVVYADDHTLVNIVNQKDLSVARLKRAHDRVVFEPV